jgi:hypothetical protein
MKTKTLNLMSLAILSLVFLIGIVSAVDFHPAELIGTVEQGQTIDLVFKIENTHSSEENTHSSDLTLISMTKTDLTSASDTLSNSNLIIQNLPSTIDEGQNSSDVTLRIIVPSTQPTGTYTGELELFGNLTAISSRGKLNVTLTIESASTDEPEEIKECSLIGNLGNNLHIEIDDIAVASGFGDDEDYWYPLDIIEIEVKLENDGSDDITDIELHWGLYSFEEEDFIIEEEDNIGKIKDGDEEVITFTIELDDPSEFEENGEFTLYVWTEDAEDDEFGSETCAYTSEEIRIITDDDFVILTDIELSAKIVECGSNLLITGKAWNVGDNEQEDVEIKIYNLELEINEIIQIGDIDEFDNFAFNAEISIPEDAEEKSYALKLVVYDEDNEIYETDEEEDEAMFQIIFDIEGNCGADQMTTLVTASLESGGKAGEELVVKAVITNTGEKSVTYTLNAAGFTEWASSADINQKTFIVDAGNSKEVMITFNVNKDVSGLKFFNLEVVSENGLVANQPVSVSIEKAQIFSLSDSFSYLWIIGALNIILIIIIVIVAIRLARK